MKRLLSRYPFLSQTRSFSFGFHRVKENEYPVRISEMRPVPGYIERPPMPSSSQINISSILRNQKQISGMQRAGEIARLVLDHACAMAVEGLTTDQLDQIVHDKIIYFGAYPSPLGYNGFPKSVCTSINNILCHGIPDERPLMNGDIINIDVTVFYKGYHGDTSRTLSIGIVDRAGMELLEATQNAMEIGISQCGPGKRLYEIGNAISKFAEENGYISDPHFCGHGIGEFFHTAPTIQHVENDDDLVMKEGMVFTVEPILVEGLSGFRKWGDNWTCESLDGLRSAQFEHTIMITKNGASILT